MRSILHVQSDTCDARAEAIITEQGAVADLHIEIVDLRIGEPDYAKLLDRIFAADSVAVW